MNNNEPAAEHYSINGFKYFSELAKEYFPDLANASSASKKMRKRIKAAVCSELYSGVRNYILSSFFISKTHQKKKNRTIYF